MHVDIIILIIAIGLVEAAVLIIVFRRLRDINKLVYMAKLCSDTAADHQSDMQAMLIILKDRQAANTPKEFRLSDIPEKQLQAIIKVVMRKIEAKMGLNSKLPGEMETWPEICFCCQKLMLKLD